MCLLLASCCSMYSTAQGHKAPCLRFWGGRACAVPSCWLLVALTPVVMVFARCCMLLPAVQAARHREPRGLQVWHRGGPASRQQGEGLLGKLCPCCSAPPAHSSSDNWPQTQTASAPAMPVFGACSGVGVCVLQVGGVTVKPLYPFHVWGDVTSDLPAVDNYSEVCICVCAGQGFGNSRRCRVPGVLVSSHGLAGLGIVSARRRVAGACSGG
jgi:hypothetical protein